MRSVDRGCRDMGTVKGNGKTDEDRARKRRHLALGTTAVTTSSGQRSAEGYLLFQGPSREGGGHGGGGSGVRRRELSPFVLITYSGAGDETLNLVYAKQVPYR